jgi:dihydroorotate dehydrogenase
MPFDLYQVGLQPLLFSGVKADPETVATQLLQWLSWLDRSPDRPPASWIQRQIQQLCCYADPRLQQTLWGISFANPVGLAAGFDKNGTAGGAWSSLGFGFAELGTVTAHPQPGNPRPRLFRLPQDRAALNRMGFNNQGSAALAQRLQQQKDHRSWLIPLGINLGKSKVTPLAEAAFDYCTSFRLLYPYGDYFVVNVSSPNTPGLRSLQAVDQLVPILTALQQENHAAKPLLLKISPDLNDEEIRACADVALQHQLAGMIASNTTIRRTGLKTRILPETGQPLEAEAGGISGAPLRERSTQVIRVIYRHTQARLPIIGVGGIFTAEDAWAKITAGASLIQVYTGWVYEGPLMVRRILQGLGQKLQEHGISSLADAVGLEMPKELS